MISPTTRVLVLGCGGMLGDAVYNLWKDRCVLQATDIDLNAPWLRNLDVRNREVLEKEFLAFQPDLVLHLAALVDLEYCETHPDDAYETNAVGTENVALLCQKHDTTMVYISTAGIFDGTQEEYHDYDVPNPLNVYGKSKYAGERFVSQNLQKYYVFRAGWMMGGGPAKDKKFVNKIMKQLQSGTKELHVVDDKLGTPTYTYNFVETMEAVLASEQYGIYNMVSTGSCSRYDVAKEILRILEKDDIALEKVDSSYWEKEYFVVRPRSEKLLTLKLNLKGLNRMRHWKENLELYLKSHDWNL